MKKFILLLLSVPLFLTFVAHTNTIKANSDQLTPEYRNEVVVDPLCLEITIVGAYVDQNGETHSAYRDDGKPICNSTCMRQRIYDLPEMSRKEGIFCVYGSTTVGLDLNSEINLLLPLEPPARDRVLIYIRGAIYAVMALTSLAVILYGLYGWYLRAMSEGEPDKVEESVKIYKNAIIGAIIVFMAVVITQFVFNFLGITTSVFEFNFIPISGYQVDVREIDAGRFCHDNQIDKTADNGLFVCVENRWVKQ